MTANRKGLFPKIVGALYDWYFVRWRRRAIVNRAAEGAIRGAVRCFVREDRTEQVYGRIMWTLIGLLIAFCVAAIGGVAWLLNYG